MVRRDITTELLEAAGEYPVVTVFGPRQSGKTTLAQMTFPNKLYFSLEDPDLRMAAETDPRGFLANLPDGGVLDEIQRLPQLLSYIQGIVDRVKKNGIFILTGSHQPELHQSVSQSLAGRTAVMTLLPFSLTELGNYQKDWEPFELIVNGAYPRLHEEGLKPARFFNGYLQTYIERDVRALINLKDLRPFQQFLTLLAGRIGQIINYTSLSNDVGVSATTIKNWISVLKASFVVFELPPFFENIRKRVVKSPKIYFSDVGLASYLLGIETSDQMFRDPLRGGFYENLVILEILKARLNCGKRPDLFFYRDTHGNEVDLVIKQGRKLIPLEIKSAATFTPDFLKGIDRFEKMAGDRCTPGFVLYNGNEQYTLRGTRVINPIKHGGVEGLW
ncbi:MAG: ATP-binding protein [Desulfobacterales bacterium]|jgi:predicted AAA+ superfamily ATPase|nr:ATP-binding protein [Desulfobacterales bacterium]MDH3828859.1 ATP-binding protein [Desulfobacterales bacterium]MDH4009423.1 ATP-binding protein [Desulfobacterales bacterium]